MRESVCVSPVGVTLDSDININGTINTNSDINASINSALNAALFLPSVCTRL